MCFQELQNNINFPVCFLETVKIILITLTVYAITVKKFETVREFYVSISDHTSQAARVVIFQQWFLLL
jgi:hypothetical protein